MSWHAMGIVLCCVSVCYVDKDQVVCCVMSYYIMGFVLCCVSVCYVDKDQMFAVLCHITS